jgi:hypothetical protein
MSGTNHKKYAEPGRPCARIADSVRLGMAFSREVACAQNMRF